MASPPQPCCRLSTSLPSPLSARAGPGHRFRPAFQDRWAGNRAPGSKQHKASLLATPRQAPPKPLSNRLPSPLRPNLLVGNAYAARKNDPDKSWQKAAYTDEIAHLQELQSVAEGAAAGNAA